jgi:type VI protein secretion system component Hcp
MEFICAPGRNHHQLVLVEFVRNSPDGKEEVNYTVSLNNATLSNIRQFSEGVRVLEDDSFTF